MSGYAQRLERDPGQLERLAALEQDVRRIGPELHPRRYEAVDVLEQRLLLLGHVHRCAGFLGQVGNAAEVVPVAVRDQNRGALGAHPDKLEPQARSLTTGIDDDRLRGATFS